MIFHLRLGTLALSLCVYCYLLSAESRVVFQIQVSLLSISGPFHLFCRQLYSLPKSSPPLFTVLAIGKLASIAKSLFLLVPCTREKLFLLKASESCTGFCRLWHTWNGSRAKEGKLLARAGFLCEVHVKDASPPSKVNGQGMSNLPQCETNHFISNLGNVI